MADDWDRAATPHPLLARVRKRPRYATTKAGRRKLLLFASASARRVWPLFAGPAEAAAFEAIERAIDAHRPGPELAAIARPVLDANAERWTPAHLVLRELVSASAWPAAGMWRSLARGHWPWSADSDERARLPADAAAERRVHADLARCVFDNPDRPTAFDPRWQTAAVVGLATAAHNARDFGRLPILADALEEAGCDAAAVLAHCRAHPHHARGCWVIDGVLGR